MKQCDPDIDIVLAKVSKPLVSEQHRHIANTESYYVFKGTLLLHIEDTAEVLNSGDMSIIYPGATHWFETRTNGEVIFCAIKRQPLSEDKELN